MSLQIPRQHVGGIAKLKQLSDDVLQRLIGALASHQPTPEPTEMVAYLATVVPEVPQDDLQKIIETLYALYYVREFSEASQSRFVSDLIQALKTSKDSLLVITPEEAPALKTRFKNLMAIESVGLLSKALKLQRNGEHLYCEARIMSDIRPVFHEDASLKPAGGVISHTLKLGYHRGAEHKEFFIILESADLEALKKTVERAIAKEVTLRDLLTGSGLKDLGV